MKRLTRTWRRRSPGRIDTKCTPLSCALVSAVSQWEIGPVRLFVMPRFCLIVSFAIFIMAIKPSLVAADAPTNHGMLSNGERTAAPRHRDAFDDFLIPPANTDDAQHLLDDIDVETVVDELSGAESEDEHLPVQKQVIASNYKWYEFNVSYWVLLLAAVTLLIITSVIGWLFFSSRRDENSLPRVD